MADETLGISFSPFGDNDPSKRPQGAPTPQQAIQVLSYRYPRVVGASSPAPAALLNGRGSAGLPGGGMDLEQLLAMLFGARRPEMPQRMEPDLGRMQLPGLQPSAPAAPSQPPAPGPRTPAPNPGVGFVDPGDMSPSDPFGSQNRPSPPIDRVPERRKI